MRTHCIYTHSEEDPGRFDALLRSAGFFFHGEGLGGAVAARMRAAVLVRIERPSVFLLVPPQKFPRRGSIVGHDNLGERHVRVWGWSL